MTVKLKSQEEVFIIHARKERALTIKGVAYAKAWDEKERSREVISSSWREGKKHGESLGMLIQRHAEGRSWSTLYRQAWHLFLSLKFHYEILNTKINPQYTQAADLSMFSILTYLTLLSFSFLPFLSDCIFANLWPHAISLRWGTFIFF